MTSTEQRWDKKIKRVNRITPREIFKEGERKQEMKGENKSVRERAKRCRKMNSAPGKSAPVPTAST